MSAPETPFYPMTHEDATTMNAKLALLIAALEDNSALVEALQALKPGLVTTTQAGELAPDAEAIEDGFIKLATSANKGLMSKAFAALLESPEALVFTKGKALTQTAGFHNALYRGKNLGTSVSAEQYAAISAGTFDDMFIGDYWVINSVTWRIAAFDYWLRDGDTECQTHHAVIVPDAALSTGPMNSSHTTAGGYVGSDWYTGANSNTHKATCKSAIEGAFGAAHILSHREYLTNAITSNYASAGAWYDSTFELMNEKMVYGSDILTPLNSLGSTIPNSYTIDYGQLPLFRYNKGLICTRASWWLRDVVTATAFASVTDDGDADYSRAGNSLGFRPAFGICA